MCILYTAEWLQTPQTPPDPSVLCVYELSKTRQFYEWVAAWARMNLNGDWEDEISDP